MIKPPAFASAPVLRLVVLLLLAGPLLTGPLFARSTTVNHGLLKVDLPGAWKIRKGATLTAVSRSHPSSQVLFVSPAPATISADAYLRKGVQGFEKNRKILKTFPARPRSGKTRGGTPFTFWGITSKGAGGVRYSAFYAFKIGSQFQTVILLSGDQAGFNALMKPLGDALDRLVASAPASGATNATAASNSAGASSGPIRPIRGRAYAYYDHVLKAPASWKPKKGRIGGERIFVAGARASGFKTQGGKGEITIGVEIQPVGATDPAAALRSYLYNRAEVGMRRLRPAKLRWKTYANRQGQLSSGQYAGFVMEYSKDHRFLFAGVALVRPDRQSTLLIGSALKINEYDNKYKAANMQSDRNQWMRWYEQLLGMAASVRWTNVPGRDQGRESWLAQKGALRYNKSSSVNSGSTSALFSTKADWKFGGDGSVKYDIERYRSFVDNSFDLYGRPDFSSGYAGNESGGRTARYQVRRQGRQYYLAVRYPSGAASLHNLSLSPFAIDGYRDGCCR